MLLTTLSFYGYAQERHKFALQGGYLLGKIFNYYTGLDYKKLETPFRSGFSLGGSYDHEFHKNFGLKTGLEYHYVGRRVRIENSTNLLGGVIAVKSSIEKTFYFNSLQVPLHAYYKVNSDFGDFKFLLGLGYQFHISGTYLEIQQSTQTSILLPNQANVSTTTQEGYLVFEKIPEGEGFTTPYHKRYNISFNIGTAYEYKKFIVELRYMLGLVNQYAHPEREDSNVKRDRYSTGTLGLNVGYYISN